MHTFAQRQNQSQQSHSIDFNRRGEGAFTTNHATSSIIPQSQETDNDAALPDITPPCFGHNFSRTPVYSPAPKSVQAKLVVNQAGDKYEQEADHIAEQVMLMPEARLQRACSCGGSCDSCRGTQSDHVQLQTERAQASDTVDTEAPPLINEVLHSSAGEPLDAASRAFFEPRFGQDFSQVRVHTDARAGDSAQSVNALAYTVGRDIVFNEGKYAPHTEAGRKLIAHELVHVSQQAGAGASGLIQRDLVTPEPEVPAPAQDDLTDAQIKEAIRFNNQFYNEANIRIIQDILGGPVTGRLEAENIRSIATIQEKYGLKKDGKIGPKTFEFIQQEQTAAGVPTTTEECLTMFRAIPHPVQSAATAGPGGTTTIRGHHVVEARFSSRCNCSQFQYRQFITGVATGSRGGVSQDLSTSFSHIPGGRLPISFQEDGNTTCTSVNYGHREQPGQNNTTGRCGEDHYTNDAGVTDQANGCLYRGEDFPQITVNGLNTGDDVDLLVEFRGEIRRNGTTIQTKRWTDISETVRTP